MNSLDTQNTQGTANSDQVPACRPQWGTRMGFILAAAGSAVGLGNIWKFPYIAGENGGGLFVLIYLACVALVGLPIMIAEIMLGRGSGQSPVGAFERYSRKGSLWTLVGWLGVLAGFIILSYYSVVAGWSLNYVLFSLTDHFQNLDAAGFDQLFTTLYMDGPANLFWHFVFMSIVLAVVLGGVKRGIEKTCNILMPLLFAIILILVGYSIFLPNDGFMKAVDFILVPHAERLTQRSVLEALGHAFFTLSLGMGAMLTYGSYLKERRDILRSSIYISALDTLIALLACLMIFPVMFSFGMEPEAGPGLVFKSLPMIFSQLPGGFIVSLSFFLLLAFAALSSAISLQEVVTATVMDRIGFSRKKATLITGSMIFVFGVPSALSGSGDIVAAWADVFGMNFFDSMDYLASNWLLPLGGFLIAIFAGWVMREEDRREAFGADLHPPLYYDVFKFVLRYVAPVLVLIVLLHKVGILQKLFLLDSLQ
jgi:neurotransmitter:Na+ symporter, NSS family